MAKKVEVTLTFTVPDFYTFDNVATVVSKIGEGARDTGAKDADVVSVVVDDDGEDE